MLQALSGVSSNPSLPAQGIFLIMANTQILAEHAGRHIEWKALLIRCDAVCYNLFECQQAKR